MPHDPGRRLHRCGTASIRPAASGVRFHQRHQTNPLCKAIAHQDYGEARRGRLDSNDKIL